MIEQQAVPDGDFLAHARIPYISKEPFHRVSDVVAVVRLVVFDSRCNEGHHDPQAQGFNLFVFYTRQLRH